MQYLSLPCLELELIATRIPVISQNKDFSTDNVARADFAAVYVRHQIPYPRGCHALDISDVGVMDFVKIFQTLPFCPMS